METNTKFSQDPSKPLVINRDPTLLEKVLEFLYQADYTVPESVVGKVAKFRKSEPSDFQKFLQANPRAKQRIYKRPANPEPDEIEDQDVLEESEQLDDESVNASPEHEDEETEDNILGDDDPFLENCHPCYFHARMYGEGDCFRIKDLKAKAKMHFTNTFLDSPDKESFRKTVEEIYSPRAVYVELRAEAVNMVVQNLKILWEGSGSGSKPPVLTKGLLKSVPEFTAELFPAFLDLCVVRNVFTHMTDPSPNTPLAKEAPKKKIEGPKRG